MPEPTAGSLHSLWHPAPREELKGLSLAELSAEVLARLNVGHTFQTDEQLVLAEQLQHALAAKTDVHLNRFAARRYYDLLHSVLARLRPSELQGATVVDLGCGSLNPFVFSFLLLMLGAERAYAIDLEPIQDVPRATRALASAAGWLLLEPGRVLEPDSITPQAVLDNLMGFHLPQLAAGDPAGIAPDRLLHRIEAVENLSLADGEADAVFSVSLVEHLSHVDDAMESLRRITKPGGVGHHLVDFADHRTYTGDAPSPFEFLSVQATGPLVHGSNRLRCEEVCGRFERHGFIVERVEAARTERLTEEEHAQFVEPYRSMDRARLEVLCAWIFVRRA